MGQTAVLAIATAHVHMVSPYFEGAQSGSCLGLHRVLGFGPRLRTKPRELNPLCFKTPSSPSTGTLVALVLVPLGALVPVTPVPLLP